MKYRPSDFIWDNWLISHRIRFNQISINTTRDYRVPDSINFCFHKLPAQYSLQVSSVKVRRRGRPQKDDGCLWKSVQGHGWMTVRTPLLHTYIHDVHNLLTFFALSVESLAAGSTGCTDCSSGPTGCTDCSSGSFSGSSGVLVWIWCGCCVLACGWMWSSTERTESCEDWSGREELAEFRWAEI